ncbi:MAG TPA: protein-disulfide reductase DsbD domain-containing protein, partial [Alphaproteobacteria bacterium]|nr:protein-disulfide reductase DsbD domain-containing protein [Alphaproteobacteria bacterium]
MSKARRRIFSILVLLAGLLAAVPASAGPAVSPWDGGPEGEVRLLAARSAAGGAATLRFGLEFRLAPGWKTYWRNPGESGAPPQFDWSGSGNLADVSVE